MSKFSKKRFLEEFSSDPEWHKIVLKQGGVDWELIKKNPYDYYAANIGSIPGMIYYKDTVKFAKKHHLKILQILDEFENECGKLERKPSPLDEDLYYNWLAWFSHESCLSEVIAFIESED